MDAPRLRYEPDGSLYHDWPFEIDQAEATTYLKVLRRNLPAGTTDSAGTDAAPDTTWVEWRYAQRAEAIARLFWPGVRVTAAANPSYQGCISPHQEALKALADARKAVMAAEALVRTGLAVVPVRPVPLTGRADQALVGAER